MALFCILLQLLICCLIPALQRPVRLTPCKSSKDPSNKVRENQGAFHNQARQLTSTWRWESKPRRFKGQQSNKGNSKYGRLYESHNRKRKRRNKRRSRRKHLRPKRHGKASLLKTSQSGCRKQVEKKLNKRKIIYCVCVGYFACIGILIGWAQSI